MDFLIAWAQSYDGSLGGWPDPWPEDTFVSTNAGVLDYQTSLMCNVAADSGVAAASIASIEWNCSIVEDGSFVPNPPYHTFNVSFDLYENDPPESWAGSHKDSAYIQSDDETGFIATVTAKATLIGSGEVIESANQLIYVGVEPGAGFYSVKSWFSEPRAITSDGFWANFTNTREVAA